MEVLDRQVVWRLEVAELEVVGGDEGDAGGAREALDGFGGAGDAVGGVRALEDLVDAEQEWPLLLACLDHLADAQDLGVEGRDTAREVVADVDRGIDGHRRQCEVLGADGGAGVGEDGGGCERAHVRRFAAHVRAGDDAGASCEGGVIRHGFRFFDEQRRHGLAGELRPARAELGPADGLARERRRGEGEQGLDFGPGREVAAQAAAVCFLPGEEARCAVEVPEAGGVGDEEEEDIAPHGGEVGELCEAVQAIRGALLAQVLLDGEQERAPVVGIFESGEQLLVDAELLRQGHERGEQGLAAPQQQEREQELQGEEQPRYRGIEPACDGQCQGDEREHWQQEGEQAQGFALLDALLLEHRAERREVGAERQQVAHGLEV